MEKARFEMMLQSEIISSELKEHLRKSEFKSGGEALLPRLIIRMMPDNIEEGKDSKPLPEILIKALSEMPEYAKFIPPELGQLLEIEASIEQLAEIIESQAVIQVQTSVEYNFLKQRLQKENAEQKEKGTDYDGDH